MSSALRRPTGTPTQTAPASRIIDAVRPSVNDGSIDHVQDARARARMAAKATVNPAGMGKCSWCGAAITAAAASAITPNIANFNGYAIDTRGRVELPQISATIVISMSRTVFLARTTMLSAIKPINARASLGEVADARPTKTAAKQTPIHASPPSLHDLSRDITARVCHRSVSSRTWVRYAEQEDRRARDRRGRRDARRSADEGNGPFDRRPTWGFAGDRP